MLRRILAAVICLAGVAYALAAGPPTDATPVDWANCLGCHPTTDSNLPALSDLRPAGLGPVLPTNCYACHTDVELAKPVREWTHPVRPVALHLACTTCHPAIAHGPGAPPPRPTGDYNAKGCYACHVDVRAARRMPYSHAETAGLRCIDCHPAHEPQDEALPLHLVPSQPRQYWMANDWESANQRCLGCHASSALMFGDTRGFVLLNTENYHARHVEQAGVMCIECHDPHGSMTPGMLRSRLLTGEVLSFYPKSGGGMCSVLCHGVEHSGFSYTEVAP